MYMAEKHYGLIVKTCLVLLPASIALAQQDRLAGPIDNRRTVILKGNRNPKADPRDDQGPLDGSHKLTAMTLLLKQSAEQQAALKQLLEDQQNPGSPDYHNWLTPDQYADRFGLSRADFARVSAWLKSQGFSVDYQAQGRNWILFSGTVKQVESAFHTPIHRYMVNGETHIANTAEPSIPAALEPVVQGVQGLDDFRLEPPKRTPKRLASDFTSTNGSHYLAPGDISIIYDIVQLYNHGITGAGQKLAIVGQTDIYMSDVSAFRNNFGLPANNPTLVLVPGSADPGYTADLDEANIDLDWSGAAAPNASILYVYSQNVVTSVQYAIDKNLAPVISMSYGGCELKISSSPASTASWYQTLAQQANGEGITWLASSGDSGATACENGGAASASSGLSVNLPASIPEVTGVGGTTFNEAGGSYWSASTSSNGTSALSYIPERAWNDTVSRGGVSSSGGGVSIFYNKPSWQNAPGVPNDNARDVPDVAFSSSPDHDGYLVMVNGQFQIDGGTSIATPVFAGIVALLNNYLVSNGVQAKAGLGNINPTLYGLARSNPGVFHDVTIGSNIVPCTIGTTNCSNGQIGYTAGPGYDLVTGLGSLDAYKLVTSWNVQPTNGTTTTLSANPAAFPVTSSTTLTATVKANSGNTAPSGAVTFAVGSVTLGTVSLNGSGSASLIVNGSQLSVGSNNVRASYGGGTGFNGSTTSISVTVTVPSGTSAVIPSIVPTPVYQQSPDSSGYSFFFTVALSEIAGIPTTLTDFTFFGTSYASQLASFFGTTAIPAYGTISAALGAKVTTIPSTGVLGFSGRDAAGATWTQQISVPFLPKQIAAAMALTSSPGTEVQNPTFDPHCTSDYPFYQELNLQEKNGYEVELTRFLAAGNDLSSSIPDWFGSWRLAPLGSLQAGICWSTNSLPTTLDYELDGVDTAGNKISVTTAVPFQGPGQSAGALSTSRASLPLIVSPGQSVSSNLTVNLPAGQQWSLSVFPSNQTTSWLVVYPLSGTGTTQVNLVASSPGLFNGAYTATLVFQSVNTIPQFVNVPITLTVGAAPNNISIGGVANAASYGSATAPGMLMYVAGSGLSNSSQLQIASKTPLPYSIGGVSATVNGIQAPIYYILPGQIVIQVPYETPAGTAFLAVNNNGSVATYSFEVSASAPGMFTDGNLQLVPTGTAKRGQSLAFFMTGEGDVTGGLATGYSPSTSLTVNQLPAPRGQFTMTVGGVAVTPLFVGIPYGLVGVTQVNFTVPNNAPTGLQNVVVTVGGYKSSVAKINVTP
jgi:uncharacterized protein (TIGR03437 family)